jgi:hypothetical protein
MRQLAARPRPGVKTSSRGVAPRRGPWRHAGQQSGRAARWDIRAGISPAGMAAPGGLKNRGKGQVRTVFL